MKRFLLTLLVAIIIPSCTATRLSPMRDLQTLPHPIALSDLEDRKDVRDAEGNWICSDLLFRHTSVEQFVDKNGKEFDVGVIEMSDDGHVADDAQKEMVFTRLREVALGGRGKSLDTHKSPGVVVVTFVHGWHHRSKVCDNNLACFRRVLQALSEAGGKSGRPVFGIYIGWRGDTTEQAQYLSFYNRKSTAHLIGHEGGREILLDLDRTYRELNDRIDNGMTHPVTMVTAGHSFGGALVFSAVEGALVRELRKENSTNGGSDRVVGRRAVDCGGTRVRPIRPGIGDLVILVNPAFEASRYNDFVEDEKTAGRYADTQLPVLLTVASEGDDAVKVAFPIGRSLYFAFHPWQRPSMSDIIGAGHYDPQTTHDLVLTNDQGTVIHPAPDTPPKVAPADAKTTARCDLHVDAGDLATCKCEYDVPELLSVIGAKTTLTLSAGSVPFKNEEISLRPRRERDPHSPYIVARVAPEIISKHSDIYTPRFITFLTAYISEFLKQASHVEPGSVDEPLSPCTVRTASAQR